MNVIYIDTLFLLNTIVDYLLLLASARIAGEPLARGRFLLGALLGGGYAVAIFILPFLESMGYKLIIFILIILISFANSRRLLRQALIFLSLSSAFAGGILAIGLLGGQGLTLQGGVIYSSMDLKIVLLSASLCYGILSLLYRGHGQHTHLDGELVNVQVTISGKEISFTGLRDTGNSLKDPISGKGVVVVDGEILRPLFPPSQTPTIEELREPTLALERLSQGEMTGRLRLLPYRAVGVQGLLLALRVDTLQIGDYTTHRPLVALSPTAVSDGGNYQGLIGNQLK
ncbi:MAG: sigma-E processing peptidase SpoIIGA [Eubacteriales bacterium]